MGFNLKILKAGNGDCILIKDLISNDKKINILIDGGTGNTFKHKNKKGDLLKELEIIKNENGCIDLLILTHIDDDHIGGILKGFKKNELLHELTRKVWFNSGKLIFEKFHRSPDSSNFVYLSNHLGKKQGNTSINQGVTFESHLETLEIWEKEVILAGDTKKLFGATFTFLSPNIESLEKLLCKWKKEAPTSLTSSSSNDYNKTFDELLLNDKFKEDASIHNGSSLAFIFEHNEKRILFLGDAHDNIVVSGLKELIASGQSNYFDFIKLSHHGSEYNTSPEFLDLIECNNFILSTDASKHGLPNKKTLARIFKKFPNASIHFNYPEIIHPKIFTSEEIETYNNVNFKLSNKRDFVIS
ncbi:ComEC/Rec2 family competence protein [Klebsiella variicola]|uniref:ComEC/Rec2 family competence protein n=1 Tax=Klebsiella variicola TaxID=244366 RepID=UPI00210E84C8|nr:MBL fold metallo-hydrolase [Klebsiella variicola]EIY5086212.1 MBL fold metallo-hydrolase [Klebsiella variicola]EKU6552266.1 MBL fold metallo-hydrolase [Klebsiella variicola]MCQ3901916.1 MBL fold metallo-hydrolase [Klebsiella variicola]HBT4772294.1 MBL fold metallo-hydrolase [Klebsiella variicola subsp. variicola]